MCFYANGGKADHSKYCSRSAIHQRPVDLHVFVQIAYGVHGQFVLAFLFVDKRCQGIARAGGVGVISLPVAELEKRRNPARAFRRRWIV